MVDDLAPLWLFQISLGHETVDIDFDDRTVLPPETNLLVVGLVASQAEASVTAALLPSANAPTRGDVVLILPFPGYHLPAFFHGRSVTEKVASNVIVNARSVKQIPVA